MIQNGSSVLVFDANGAPIACQRNVDVTFNDDMIDVTCKQDNGFSTFLPGKRSFSMTCEALTDWGQNLLLYSEEFDNASWVKEDVTITSNSVNAPDGTLTADTITPNTNNTFHGINQSFTFTNGQTYTLSYYIKLNGYNFAQILLNSGISLAYCNINLSTGALNNQGFTTANIITLINNWYRVDVTFTSSVSVLGAVVLGVVNNINSTRAEAFTGDGTSGIYAWGAQLNTGSTAQSYYQTTSTVNPNIDTLVSANLNRTKVELNIANPAFDDIYFNGEAYVESIELNAGTETEASYTVTFSGTGDLVSLVS